MRIGFYQEGGAMPTDEGAGQDPVQQLVTMAAQAVQTNDPNLAMQVCQGLVELAQASAQQQAPETQEPVPETGEEEGEPVYGKGGVLLRRVRH